MPAPGEESCGPHESVGRGHGLPEKAEEGVAEDETSASSGGSDDIRKQLADFRGALLAEIHSALAGLAGEQHRMLGRQETALRRMLAEHRGRLLEEARPNDPPKEQRVAAADEVAPWLPAPVYTGDQEHSPSNLFGGERTGPRARSPARELATQERSPSNLFGGSRTGASAYASASMPEKGADEHALAKVLDACGRFAGTMTLEAEVAPESSRSDEAVRTDIFAQMAATQEIRLQDKMYDVRDCYHKTGFAQAVVKSWAFRTLTHVMIAANALYLGIDVDQNEAESLNASPWAFQACEHGFCLFFVLEWLVRFIAFRRKRDCVRDWWFRFDTFQALVIVTETWLIYCVVSVLENGFWQHVYQKKYLYVLRIVRLTRLFRITKLVQLAPELATMSKGMMMALRAAFSSLFMVSLMTYVFSIVIFTVLQDGDGVEHFRPNFDTLPRCMFTLLLHGTLMAELGDLAESLLAAERWVPLIVLMVFVLLSAVTLMNLLIGVLCEVIRGLTAQEDERAALALMNESVVSVLKELDKDGSGTISREELGSMLKDKRSMEVLCSLKVNVLYLMELRDMIFPEPESYITIASFVDLILACRGNRAATVEDLIRGHQFTRWSLVHTLELVEKRWRKELVSLVGRQHSAKAAADQASAPKADAGHASWSLTGRKSQAKPLALAPPPPERARSPRGVLRCGPGAPAAHARQGVEELGVVDGALRDDLRRLKQIPDIERA